VAFRWPQQYLAALALQALLRRDVASLQSFRIFQLHVGKLKLSLHHLLLGLNSVKSELSELHVELKEQIALFHDLPRNEVDIGQPSVDACGDFGFTGGNDFALEFVNLALT